MIAFAGSDKENFLIHGELTETNKALLFFSELGSKRLGKGPKERIKKKKMPRNYPGFYLFILKKKRKEKRERQCIHSSLKGCKERRIFNGYHVLMENTRKGIVFSQKWYIKV